MVQFFDLYVASTTINKKVKSFIKETAESHLPYNDQHLKNIMQRLDATDPYLCKIYLFHLHQAKRNKRATGTGY